MMLGALGNPGVTEREVLQAMGNFLVVIEDELFKSTAALELVRQRLEALEAAARRPLLGGVEPPEVS